MNNGNGWERKLRHGSASLGICAAVIAAVLLLNIGMTALCNGRLWYIDLTPEVPYNVYGEKETIKKYSGLYTLMDETVDYLDYIIDEANKTREEPVQVDIIFCAEPDILKQKDSMRYVYYTALNLQKKFPETIKVSYRDVWSNPSSVDMYRSTSYSNIYQSNIIVASGSEYRVSTVRSYYTYDSESAGDVPVAYNGQKQFVKQILDVTGAEAPICALTVNHGEPFANLDLADRENWEEYGEFMNVIEGAGYEIQFIDLEKDEIPENCRLIITFDPQTDFVSAFGNDAVEVAETVKLDRFLAQSYSYMVFMDADTPAMPNLEEYLRFWGIEYMRAEGKNESGETVTGNYVVTDALNALDGTGNTFVAQYPVGKGSGAAALDDIISSTVSPKVIFGNAIPIAFSSNYDRAYVMEDTKNGVPAYSYGTYSNNGWMRTVFDMFHAGTDESRANYTVQANGEILKDQSGAPLGGADIFNVMTLSAEKRTVAEGMGYTNVNKISHVCAVGSTEFAKDAVLASTSYGNTDALLAVLRYMGKEVNPVGLSFLALSSTDIGTDYHKTTDESGATQVNSAIIVTTVALTVIPALAMIISGAVILLRRRVRH